MKKWLKYVMAVMGLVILFSGVAWANKRESEASRPEKEFDYLLPEDFKVYAQDDTVICYSAPGFEERILPTFNYYKGNDGGYVAVYSKKRQGSIYSVGGGIYVIGQIRLKGEYVGRIFYPDGYSDGDDITQDAEILKLCDKYFPNFKGKMWIGGDTGGWFGIQ